ncbi:MAG: hypothetical protein JG781_54 [Peptococcaceae bacterium]|jgi:uncharacterized membrane protein|uniref:DUF2273 domain-containing protein n=1 Tax=Thermanaerosceptrum fracticalcis TaxID=1712410 RepID=A0A7G6E0D0_THEFR|nr:DUF2273 domain-containing protein [Thermanaerosceptrum fracticalcis]MBZ4652719.1 hypothetical protein [Peptococcaceae bacterium]QNB45534.1 DUF2273 domain-containing protein [Thermanaerosceptrum fracticalcis]
MWEKVLTELMRFHRGKIFGIFFGLLFSILVITVGFLQTIFIACCIYVGYIIGKRVDDNESLKEVMERIFRER